LKFYETSFYLLSDTIFFLLAMSSSAKIYLPKIFAHLIVKSLVVEILLEQKCFLYSLLNYIYSNVYGLWWIRNFAAGLWILAKFRIAKFHTDNTPDWTSFSLTFFSAKFCKFIFAILLLEVNPAQTKCEIDSANRWSIRQLINLQLINQPKVDQAHF
jgi:hypothetical protein